MVARQQAGEAFDLPPVTEFAQVAHIAATLGAHRGGERCVGAKLFDQRDGVVDRVPAGKEIGLHERPFTRPSLPVRPTNNVNRSFTMQALAKRDHLWQERRMAKRSPVSGGFFLILGILGGAVYGAINGALVLWTLVGTLVGIVAAILVWLVHRKRA